MPYAAVAFFNDVRSFDEAFALQCKTNLLLGYPLKREKNGNYKGQVGMLRLHPFVIIEIDSLRADLAGYRDLVQEMLAFEDVEYTALFDILKLPNGRNELYKMTHHVLLRQFQAVRAS